MSAPTVPFSKIPNFDPHRVPVLGTDAHLPAVVAAEMAAEALVRRFKAPPAWEPEVVEEKRFTDRQPAQAAVLVPIVLHPRPTVLLTERTTNLSTHSGQVAFPGGRVDDTDADVAAAALREAHEEVGLEASFVDVIGTLPVYITGTAFIITPVVALVRPGFELKLNPYEVADAFEVPLDFLMDPANHRRHEFTFQDVRREWFSMPWQETLRGEPRERFVWGATAGMIRNLYRFLAA